MKRTFPLIITALAGFILIISAFVPVMESLGEEVAVWFDVLASIAFILGGGNLLRMQLQTISDRKPGWGYGVLTLVSFLLMLVLGMFKVGCPPQPSVESYGISQTPLSPEALPETRVPGRIPVRGDGTQIPALLQQLIRQDGDELVVRGWLVKSQVAALQKFDEPLSWQVTVQELSERAVPPANLRSKLAYDVDHSMLTWQGHMSTEDEVVARELLRAASVPAAAQALDQLAQAARAETVGAFTSIPAKFAIPASAKGAVQRSGNQLTLHGPLTAGMRDAIAFEWSGLPRVVPLSALQREDLVNQLQAAGPPLTENQRKVFDAHFAADWTAEAFVQAINSAGVVAAEAKSPRELQAEIRAGVERPVLSHEKPPEVLLNPEQVRLVQEFTRNPVQPAATLVQSLQGAGTLTEAQAGAVGEFLQNQPTVAQSWQALCFKLLRAGPLNAAQRELLLKDAREEFKWRQELGHLFLAAHRVKYPWAGEYDAQGSPFWWLYAYVFQPLTTTTFAVLAFYVASAAFRAFRAKNLEAILLLGTAFVILLGRTYVGLKLTEGIPDSLSALRLDQMTVYLLKIFTTAGNRAIMIGIALGTISTSLQVLLGIDRSYLGRGDK